MTERELTNADIGKKFYKKTWLSNGAWPKYFVLSEIKADDLDVVCLGTTTPKEGKAPPHQGALSTWWLNESWLEYDVALTDAIDSGKDFRFINDDGCTGPWLTAKTGLVTFVGTDKTPEMSKQFLLGRFELKPDPVPVSITKERIEEVYRLWIQGEGDDGEYNAPDFKGYLIRQLGL